LALREALLLGAFSATALSGDYDAAATTRDAATTRARRGRALQQPARSTARCLSSRP